MSVLATIRPDDWNFPLLVHVLGATLLVGGLVAAVTALLLGWRRDSQWFSRLGFRSLLIVAFPSWWIMRIGGQWIESKENFEEDNEPAWLGIGYITAELGGLLLLISIILTGIGVRRLRRPGAETSILVRIGTVLAVVILLAYVVAMWAMTAKPD
jgi:Ca2+/H+ antiporter